MKIKNIILTLVVALVAFMPTLKVSAKDPVKVYIFEAGGCPYCEAELEYLQGLEGYGEKFVVEVKQLYVDHIDWEPGEDYELGKNVSDAFNAAGFEDATYLGTPLVVISDIYAMSALNEDLESVINEAYEKGDADVVSCIAAGNKDCIANPGKKKDYTYITIAVVYVGLIAILGFSKSKAN